MSFFQSLLMGDLRDAILIVGDSIARGNSTAAGPTPTAGTVQQWDDGNTQVINVGATDLIEAATGSQWPDCGIRYHSLTGRIPVFIDTGVGGSGYRYDPDADLSWYNTGNLWSESVTKTRRALNFMGRTDPDVVIIHLGLNDANKAPFTTTLADIEDLIDRINTEYHNPRIMVCQPTGPFLTTYALLDNLFQIRKWHKQLSIDYSNVELAFHLGNLERWGGCFQGDNVHLNADGNGFFGNRLAIQLSLGNNIHKVARGWIANFYFLPSVTRQGWANTFANALDSAGLLYQLEALHVLGNMGRDGDPNDFKNATQDWAGISQGGPSGTYTLTHQWFLSGSGTGNWFEGQYSIYENFAAMESDFISGVFLGTVTSGSGSIAAVIGTRESAAGAIVILRSTGGGALEFCACDGVADSDATEGAFASNSHYAVARSGGNKLLIKNDTTVKTVARASIPLNPAGNLRNSRYSAYNSNGSVINVFTGGVRGTYCAKYSTFDVATFRSIWNTFASNWFTNVQ